MLPFNIFHRKKKKKKGIKRAIGILVVPVAIFLSLLFVWFLADDFWLYAQLLLLNGDGAPSGTVVNQGDRVGGLTDPNFSGVGGSSGSGGINLGLINAMSAGYLQDYLTIASKHADYTFMNLGSYDGTNLDVFKLADGGHLQLDVTDILGVAFNETGANKGFIPTSTIAPAHYGERVGDSACTFYNVTSEWLKKYGLEYVADNFDYSPGWILTGAETSSDPAHTTQFQFSSSFFNLYPAGTNNISDSNPYDRWLKTPSTLKPGTVDTIDDSRKLADSDAAYLPDQISAMMRSAYGRMLNSSVGIDKTKLDSMGEQYVKYMGYPIGHHNGSLPKFLAFGCHKDTEVTGLTKAEAGAYAANQMGEVCAMVNDWLHSLTDPDSSDFPMSPGIRKNYQALSQGLLIFGKGGFVRTDTSYEVLKASLSDANSMAGFVLALQLVTGDTSKNADDVTAWFNSNESSWYRSSLPNYGSPTTEHKSWGYCPYIYVIDDAATVSYNGGPQVPLLHCWNKTDCGGLVMQMGGGTYGYWKCLQSAGVDCTFQEAINDPGGTLVEDIPQFSSNAATIQQKIAEAACLLAWEDGTYDGASHTSATIAEKTWGNAMYIAVRATVMPKDSYWRSCDRFVCTAIRWAGADDCMTGAGPAAHARKCSHWKEIGVYRSWSEAEKVLQPGDLLTKPSGSGHYMIYVGDMCAQVYPQYSDSINSHNLAHASIAHGDNGTDSACSQAYNGGGSGRSGKLSSTESYVNSKGITVYRCVEAEVSSKYTGALTAAEISYLKANPFQTPLQYYRTNGPACSCHSHSGSLSADSRGTVSPNSELFPALKMQ